MSTKYIKMSICFALVYMVQCMGCSSANALLAMYRQQGGQAVVSHSVQCFSILKNSYEEKKARSIEHTIVKKSCPGIACFDFFGTLFLYEDKEPSHIRELQLFPNNKDTLYTLDTMVGFYGGGSGIHVAGNKIVVAMFHGKIQLWEGDLNRVTRAPRYHALHLEALVKASLEAKQDWLRDPNGLREVIVALLNQNYKVVFYGFLECPHLIPFTLKYIGLTEKQIRSIYMLSASSKFESDATCTYAIWRVLQKLLGSQTVDYTLVLGDSFYKYAVRFGRSPDRFHQHGVHIVIPISQVQMYDWKKLLLVTGRLSNLIEACKEPSEDSEPWHTKLDARQNAIFKPNSVGMSYSVSNPKIMGMTYTVIKYIGPRAAL